MHLHGVRRFRHLPRASGRADDVTIHVPAWALLVFSSLMFVDSVLRIWEFRLNKRLRDLSTTGTPPEAWVGRYFAAGSPVHIDGIPVGELVDTAVIRDGVTILACAKGTGRE